jgi:hypothetical protein
MATQSTSVVAGNDEELGGSLGELSHRLAEMPRYIATFSQGLRSLCAKNVVSGTSPDMASVCRVRDALRRDVNIYVSPNCCPSPWLWCLI